MTEAELLVRAEQRPVDLKPRSVIHDLLSEDGIYVINTDRRIASGPPESVAPPCARAPTRRWPYLTL